MNAKDDEALIGLIVKKFRYCKETGAIYNIVAPKRSKRSFDPDAIVGFVMNNGYRALKVGGKRVLCHRVAFVLVNGFFPKFEIDHINGNKIDNRWDNLRECTSSQNQQNQVKLKTREAASKFIGVSYSKEKRKWISSIDVDRKRIFLGAFKDEIDAASAYAEAKAKHHKFNPVVRSS